MSTIHVERQYRCFDDCEISGCPGHIATLDLQTVSNAWHFSDGRGQDFYPNDGALQAIMMLLGEVAEYRVEAQVMIDSAVIEHPPKQQPKEEQS